MKRPYFVFLKKIYHLFDNTGIVLKSKKETHSGKKVRKGKKKKPIRLDLQAGFDKSGELARVRVLFGAGNFISFGPIDGKVHMSIGETHHGAVFEVSDPGSVYYILNGLSNARWLADNILRYLKPVKVKTEDAESSGVDFETQYVPRNTVKERIKGKSTDITKRLINEIGDKADSIVRQGNYRKAFGTDSIDGPFDESKDIKWASLHFLNQLHPDRLLAGSKSYQKSLEKEK